MNTVSLPAPVAAARPRRAAALEPIAVLVLPRVSLLSLAAILEPLDRAEGSEADLRCRTFGLARRTVRTRTGQEIRCDGDGPGLLEAMARGRHPRVLILCAGQRIAAEDTRAALPLIRRAVRNGTRLIGIGGASALLAEAGLLDGAPVAAHWKSARALAETHPRVDVKPELFAGGDRADTCAGELATLDMMLDLIRRAASPAAAQSVCDHLLVGYPRPGGETQPGARGEGLRFLPEDLREVIGRMADNIERPLSMSELLEGIGMSSRQFERLFKRHLSTTPMPALP